jgi:lipoprotein-anchoring transpeptidase ErfK/SrfK
MAGIRGIAIGKGLALLACVGVIAVAGKLGLNAAPAPAEAAAQAVAAHPASRPTPQAVAAATPVPAADQAYVVKRVLDIPSPVRIGDYAWDDAGVPDGPVVITVDLEAGMLSVFRDGYEIGTAAILYGVGDKPTPLGTFPISQKDADHHSTIYDGAPMPYMLRLTGDGVSIHGSAMKSGWATHGCVGVPVAFAAKLFHVAKIGDPVIVTSGKRLAMGGAMAGAIAAPNA